MVAAGGEDGELVAALAELERGQSVDTTRRVNWLRNPAVLGEIARLLGDDFPRFCAWADVHEMAHDGPIPIGLCRLISRAVGEWKYIAVEPTTAGDGLHGEGSAIVEEWELELEPEEEEDFGEVQGLRYLSVLMGRSCGFTVDGRLWSDDEEESGHVESGADLGLRLPIPPEAVFQLIGALLD
jgi:hypothetical protein